MVKFAISRNLRKNFGVRLYRGGGGSTSKRTGAYRGGGGVQKVAILSVRTLWMIPIVSRRKETFTTEHNGVHDGRYSVLAVHGVHIRHTEVSDKDLSVLKILNFSRWRKVLCEISISKPYY